MNLIALVSLCVSQIPTPPVTTDTVGLSRLRDQAAAPFWTFLADQAALDAALSDPEDPAAEPACPVSEDAWAETAPGVQRTFLGYESGPRQICALDPAPETRPPAEPPSREYVVTKDDLAKAREAKQDVFAYLYGDQADTVSRFNRLDPRFVRAGRKILVPDLADGQTEYAPLPAVYPPALRHRKFILIDLKRQFLGLYECGRLAASYPVSTGRSERGPKGENYRTPTGDFRVHAKNKDAKSSKYPEPDGGAPMPYAVNFIFPGYWMHGGDLVGFAASHGCVRELYTDAPKIFAWAGKGIPVRVVRSVD